MFTQYYRISWRDREKRRSAGGKRGPHLVAACDAAVRKEEGLFA